MHEQQLQEVWSVEGLAFLEQEENMINLRNNFTMVEKSGDKGFITFLIATAILVLAGLYNAGLGKDFLSPIATIISAILAIFAVAYNVGNQNRLANDARERKLIAAKASLSGALSDITYLCDGYIKYLANGSKGTYYINIQDC